MSGIKGKNLGTSFHLYSLYSEDKQEEEYRTPKTSVCVRTRKYLDPDYTEKKKPRPQKPPKSLQQWKELLFISSKISLDGMPDG